MSTTPLPPLYASWMEECFGGELPSENRATCDDCAMCGEAAERDGTPPELRFDPTTKCCTYHPNLPNFAVGAIVRDRTGLLAARDVVLDLVRKRRGATPLGLFAGPEFAGRYAANRARGAEENQFGKAGDLACPFFAAG